MNIEDLLGDSPEVQARVQVLNQAITLAHEHGMKAHIWAHEFSGTGLEVCYAPDSPVWEARARAYRAGLARIPDVDGMVLMFGSAPMPPWATACLCEWCMATGEENSIETPSQDERIRLITEHVGRVVVHEMGQELFVRTFVHEPAEVAWHSDGLASVQGLHFTGMHKGPVQDWQPYHPHHPCTGHIGPHPSILEEDVAGEYCGLGHRDPGLRVSRGRGGHRARTGRGPDSDGTDPRLPGRRAPARGVLRPGTPRRGLLGLCPARPLSMVSFPRGCGQGGSAR